MYLEHIHPYTFPSNSQPSSTPPQLYPFFLLNNPLSQCCLYTHGPVAIH